MEFRTQYDKCKVESCPGDRFRILYAPEYDDEGRLIFNEVGKEDTYAYIQSFADSVDIYSILDRYANGELDVLERVQGFYIDVCDMPTTYQDVLNMNLKTQQFFEELPVEVKKEFDNSYEEFMIALGDKDFQERINNVLADDNPLRVGMDSSRMDDRQEPGKDSSESKE